jgi:translation initiation factor IF-2
MPIAPETREYKPSVDREEQRIREEREERRAREEHEERSRKLPTRFATAKPSYKDEPKGKGRDKARRREQFLDRDEDNEEDLEKARRRKELKAQRKMEKEAKKAAAPTPILLPEYITVANLAMALKVRVETFVEKLGELGYEATSTDHILNAEDSGLIAMEYNFEAIIDRSESEDLKAREPATDPSLLPQRPPVVTIMGHVDHGKTTLLDWLRKSSVAATEHGGITQHIGAFSVPMPSGKIITFLDTPGHAAFLSMRQRGANVTDIVILVVAADDSVKPQTIEAINHAKKAKVPIIVAINKIDKEDANIDRVKQDLARHGVDVEDFGGDTQVVCVSGKTGKGMEELEEAAVTLSEILDMRAETDGQSEGWVLEASIKSMGKVATVLVRRGTMRPGDFIVAGNTWARIRCLRNEAGVEIESAGPGTPVEIDGWREQPLAGDEVLQAPDESKAKSVIEYRLENAERDKMAQDMEAINESRKAEQEKREREKENARLAAEAEANDREYVPETGEEKPKGPKEVFFIVKGDVSGSVEAVIDSISVLGNKEVQPRILRSGVGQLAEFDIEHAAAAKGHVINFNTTLDPHISALAEKNKVTIIDQNIIYRLVDDVRAELSKYLPPLITQKVLGEAEIAQVFSITVKGRQQRNIAGCKIRNGTVFRNSKVRVHRNGEKVFDGKSNCSNIYLLEC